MQLHLEVESTVGASSRDIDMLLSLHRWLLEESEGYGGKLSTTPLAQSEELGAVAIISLIVGSGFSVANLIIAIANWRRNRPDAASVVVTRVDAAGASIRIESADPDAIAAAIRALEAG